MFGDRNQARTAACTLKRLEQTTSVVAYTAEFHRLATKTTWNESACINQFLEGLRDNVKRNMVGLTEPTTLTGWINLAIKVDERIHECLIDSKGKHNNNNNFNRNTYRRNTNNWIMNPTISEHSHSSPAQSTPRPSSITTTNYTSPKGPLTQEEKNCH